MAGKFMPRLAGKRLFSLFFALVLTVLAFAQNPIITENALAGNPYSEWGVPDFRDTRIAGFTTQMSLNAGQTVHFKITVQSSATYTMKIYRIGYYGGNGARLMQNLGTLSGVAQPLGVSNSTTGLLDCDNWSESAQWAIPANAVSGLYIAKIERTGGGSNHIAFVVRSDAGNSDLYLQFPDATWQAYNGYGGNNVYDGSVSQYPNGHATKVSYNRPFFVYNSLFNVDGRGSDWYMNAEYPMIRWLERNGYNVSYTTCEDISANPGHLLTHKVYISVGHDEYVSKEQRNNIEAARNAGVNLAFFSGNEFYWKTRYENDANGDARRTLVCYKEGLLGDGSFGERTCGGKCDLTSNEWTGLWRTGANYDGGRPENALTGQMSWDETPGAIQVPASYKKLRFWRNTSVATLGTGQVATLAPNTLGYEWDYEQYQGSYPEARMTMSSTLLNNKTHKLSLYRHSSGALVFGAGTIQWSWGLDGAHAGGSAVVSKDMQQATVNLFADMGVQPGTLQADLVAAAKSTDLTAPSTTITSPATGASFPTSAPITITGTVTDGGGGVVAGVEVSNDGGLTWHPATVTAIDGTATWSYTFTEHAQGSITVKARGFDDSGNKETPGAGINLTITPAICPCNVFDPSYLPANPRVTDGQGIAVGMKFRVTQNGTISGVRYYKGAGTTGTHKGQLWSSTGTLLAQATFTNETASGWQQVLFSAPVAINANTTYVVSYHSPSGDYASTNLYFDQHAEINGYLRGLASGEDGPNGLYEYSATAIMPGESYLSANYWVDVVFNTTSGPDNTPPVVTTVTPPNGSGGISIGTTAVANFNEAVNAASVTTATFQLKDPGNNIIPASVGTSGGQITLTPSAALTNSTTYTVTVKGGASGVKDLANNALATDYTWTFTTAAAGSGVGETVFQLTDVPSAPLANDGQGIALGMKFRASQNGNIVGIRFYKGAGGGGVHTGQLWTSAGALLAQATFTNETASGWQQVLLSNSVAITANTTYIVSYHSASGDYAATKPYFTQAVQNGSLRGLADGEDGPNGLYMYTATPALPTFSFQSSNYWVDVVFNTGTGGGDVTPPAVTTVTPANGATGIATTTTVAAVFNEAMTASTITTTNVELRNPSNVLVTATVAYNAATNTVTLTPSAALAINTVYTATIKSGATGVKDAAGNALVNDYVWSFTTVAGDVVPPTVTTVTPANNATGVAVNTTVTAVFSEAMTAASINASTVLLRNSANTLITATVAYNATNNTVTLTPSAALATGTVYTARVLGKSAGVKDAAGNALASDFVWTFITVAVDNISPTVTLVSPTSGASNVNTNTSVIAVFSENMNASTITTANFELRGGLLNGLVASTVTYNAATRTAILVPNAALGAISTYTATIKSGSTGVKDAAGNALAANFAWSFSTPLLGSVAPTVVAVSPANTSTGIATNTALTVVFNESMTASTITTTNIQLKNPAGTVLAATVAYSAANRTATLTPTAALLVNTVYTATVKNGSTGVKNAGGTAMSAAYNWTFTTVETVPPTVTAVTPANAATGIALNTTLTATFSEAMNASTITAGTFEVRDAASALVNGTVAYNATTRVATFSPVAALDGGVYTATIKAGATGVKDASGNALAANFVWSFTTIVVDNTPPTITSVTPANGATGIATNTTVTGVFNEAMTAATITTTNVELRNPSNVLVTATVAYNATTRTVTLTPSAALTSSTVYTATIKGGSTGVKDAAGNALAANYVWSFTTLFVDVTPPTVTSVTPANGSTGVGTGTALTATFSEAMTASTITTTNIELRNPSNVLVTATVAYNAATNTATLTPSAVLANSTVYTATIKSGATGVKDAAGNALAANFVWSFTTAAGDLTPPTITSVTPANGTVDVSTSVNPTVVFNEAMTASTITTTNVELRNPSNVLVTATVAYNATTRTATLTPSAPLANSTVYTATVKGGSTGVKDAAGNALAADFAWSFTTADPAIGGNGVSIFASTTTPTHPRDNDGQGIELGMKFRASVNGTITAIRYYKGAGGSGTHLGNLWSSTGTLLGQVTFTGETASGWQQANLVTPVSIVANTTYVVSYFSPSGDYASTNPFFTQAVVNGPLRALANGEDGPNGLYNYTSASVFPAFNYQSSNYWVDVVFQEEQSRGLITGLVSGLTDIVGGTLNGLLSRSLDPIVAQARIDQEVAIAKSKEVVISPNPSSSYFTIQLRKLDEAPLSITVSDVFGRVIERREKVAPVASLQLGHTWRTGTYFVEVRQGNERKVIKLIKVN